MMRGFNEYRERLRLREAGGPGIEGTDRPVWFVLKPALLPHPRDLDEPDVTVRIYARRHLHADRLAGNVLGPFWSREDAEATRAAKSDHAVVWCYSLRNACGMDLTLTLDEFVAEVKFWAGDYRSIEWDFTNLPDSMAATVREPLHSFDEEDVGGNINRYVSYEPKKELAWGVWDTSVDIYDEGAVKEARSLGELWAAECDTEPLEGFAEMYGLSGTVPESAGKDMLETWRWLRRAAEAKVIEFIPDTNCREWRIKPRSEDADE